MVAADLSLPQRTFVLVGMMGAGKTCIGRRLAERLGAEFIDADDEIETAAGCKIEDIFEIYGEQAFRDVERRVIARLLDGPPHVMATGGGAFMDQSTRDKIRERAVSIWLRADIDLLLSRVARRTDRPLLKSGDQRKTLESLMRDREPTYGEADIVVDTGRESPDATVDKVLAALQDFAKSSSAAVQ